VPDEDHKERVNRELIELLNEVRVALPGAQVLFAFLLIVPFTNRFVDLTSLQRVVYFASFAATGAGTALLIAPTTYHRLRFRQPDKEGMVFTANKLAIAGSIFVMLAISGVVFLVTDVLYKTAWAAIATAATAAWFTWFWYGLPLRQRASSAH
jgi:hypothetical protein